MLLRNFYLILEQRHFFLFGKRKKQQMLLLIAFAGKERKTATPLEPPSRRLTRPARAEAH